MLEKPTLNDVTLATALMMIQASNSGYCSTSSQLHHSQSLAIAEAIEASMYSD